MTKQTVRVKCTKCDGVGFVKVDSKLRVCPVCLGNKTIRYDTEAIKKPQQLRIDN